MEMLLLSLKDVNFHNVCVFLLLLIKVKDEHYIVLGCIYQDLCLSNGQQYIAISCVKTRGGLKVPIVDDDIRTSNTTTNVEYQEVFHRI